LPGCGRSSLRGAGESGIMPAAMGDETAAGAPTESDRRERRAAWLARLERWTDWPLTLLALALIPLLLAPSLFDLSPHTQATLDDLDYLIWGVFAADLLAKLAIAPQRRAYLRAHWFDVVLVALPVLRPLRLVRSVRALQALRAVRSVAALARVLAVGRRVLVRRGLHYALLAALACVLVGGSLATAFERDAPDATIRTLPDGLWWAITTVTTVGYGDTFPRTAAGRGVGVALMVLGIALFGIVTANLAAFFVEEREDEVLIKLRALDERLRRIEEALADRARPPEG
jgi:voltage-gated potassium channel